MSTIQKPNVMKGCTTLGLYPYDGKIYALVLQKEPECHAMLYFTTSLDSGWSRVDHAEIDLSLAGSPAVVFMKKIWFIGGSAIQPNTIGNKIGTYDFSTGKWSLVETDAKTIFPERMGHKCMVKKNEKGEDSEIWVIGGYTDDGPLDDIWTSKDGINWTNSVKPIPGGGRCLVGAAFFRPDKEKQECLWIFGGFTNEPGGDFASPVETYLLKTGIWEQVKWLTSGLSGMPEVLEGEFRACSLMVLGNKMFLLCTIYHESKVQDRFFQIYLSNDNGKWTLAEYDRSEFGCAAIPLSFFRIETCSFNSFGILNAVFPYGSNFEDLEDNGKLYYLDMSNTPSLTK